MNNFQAPARGYGVGVQMLLLTMVIAIESIQFNRNNLFPNSSNITFKESGIKKFRNGTVNEEHVKWQKTMTRVKRENSTSADDNSTEYLYDNTEYMSDDTFDAGDDTIGLDDYEAEGLGLDEDFAGGEDDYGAGANDGDK